MNLLTVLRQRFLSSLSLLGLLAILLFAQTAALIHSEIHPFHHHSEQCHVFVGVEHQATDVTPFFSLASLTPVYHKQALQPLAWRAAFIPLVHLARAPPKFWI